VKLRQVDLAYIAGFFDGEGTVVISRRKGYVRVEVAVSQNTRTVLDLHTRMFGGHVYAYAPKKRPRAIIYQWKVYGEAATGFLQIIEPYLLVKKVEAQEGIAIWLDRKNTSLVDEILAIRKKRKEDRLQWLNPSEPSLPVETLSTEPLGLPQESLSDS